MNNQIMTLEPKDELLSTRDNKNETLSTDLKKAEKKLDLIKQVCHSTEKKITACLQLLPSGHLNNNSFTERNLNNINPMNSSLINKSISSNAEDALMDTLLLEKKQKKVPEVQLHQTLQEMGDLFDNDSILGITLTESGEIQKQLSKELLRYEQDVERLCLSPLNDIMENDIPAVLKSRKQLNKASTEVDNLKLKLNQAIKHNQQNGQQQVKIDSLTKELQDSSNRLIQIKNNFITDLYHFLGREAEFACIYVQLFKLRANYHKNVVDIIEQNMPRLENIILSTNQKPVFGTSLIEYAEQTNRDLSIVVEYCICILNDNLNEEGLFRVPGSTSKVKKLKTFFNMQTYQQIQEYNENQLNGVKDGSFYAANLDNYEEFMTDPHSVAGCLKSFFRELPEPLFVFSIYDDLVKCASISNINDRLTALWKIINSMPKPHIENLRYLIKFFAKLAANQEVNKMTPQNLSIAVAPSLIWAPPSTSQSNTGNNSPTGINQMTYGLDMCSANQYGIIIETLILYSDWFFKDNIEFDSLKRNCSRKSSTENILKSPQPTTPTNRTPTNQSQQNSPKSTSKSFSVQYTNSSSNQPFSGSQFMNNQFVNNKDRNPLPTPRMSTHRTKKAPAPQIPPISKALNQSNGNKNNGLNISSQNLNDTSNFVTNSPFIVSNQNSYSVFQGDSKSSSNELPTLKSFERKGSFQNDYRQQSSTPLSVNKKRLNSCKDDGNSSSSGTGSTSSQDSVNSLNSNTIIEQRQKQNDKIKISNNSSNDSLLSNTEPNYQNIEQLSSSSSENLDVKEIKNQPILSTFTPRLSATINKTPDPTSFNVATYGSLDRCQLRQLPAERSRQIGQKRTSSSFINQQTRSISKPNNRPTSIPPPVPSTKPPLQKPRSHDDLLIDSNDFKNDDEKETKNKNINKLKLDVAFINDQEESNNVSYVKLDGNESVKFKNQSNEFDDEKVNFNNNILDDNQFKLPPPEKPPRPASTQIFKSSKSLMNEHTYL